MMQPWTQLQTYRTYWYFRLDDIALSYSPLSVTRSPHISPPFSPLTSDGSPSPLALTRGPEAAPSYLLVLTSINTDGDDFCRI